MRRCGMKIYSPLFQLTSLFLSLYKKINACKWINLLQAFFVHSKFYSTYSFAFSFSSLEYECCKLATRQKKTPKSKLKETREWSEIDFNNKPKQGYILRLEWRKVRECGGNADTDFIRCTFFYVFYDQENCQRIKIVWRESVEEKTAKKKIFATCKFCPINFISSLFALLNFHWIDNLNKR